MAEHTPGPWFTQIASRGAFDITTRADEFESGSVVLCARASWPHRADESHANARLIAASPDLLAACERALTVIDNLMGDSDLLHAEDSSAEFQACQMLSAAIAKARGTP